MVGTVAGKLVKGQLFDILKTPTPAFMHFPRTYLESACIDMSFCSKYMTKAAHTEDPVERLKLIVSMYVGGHHINTADIQCRAPLNPILGETIQRVLPDGTTFYGEQTSHHPPVTNFICEGPDECYRYSGFFEIKVWLSGMNSISGTKLGKQVIAFKDGGLLSIRDPNLEIGGLAYGDRV